MRGPIFIDSGPLGYMALRRHYHLVKDLISEMAEEGRPIVVPAIIDYELRREMLREKMDESVKRLNEIIARTNFDHIDSEHLLVAAAIWAEARGRGRAAAPPEDIDADAILAAQALRHRGSVVLTSNPDHLYHYGVKVRAWVRPRP